MFNQSEFFSSVNIIHSYNRTQALADGALIDVTETACNIGFIAPVAISRAAWADCVQWSAETQSRKISLQNEPGRLSTVLSLALHACRRDSDSQRKIFKIFRVPTEGVSGRARRVELAIHISQGSDAEPAITITLPSED
jgi:hypothetical protein